MTAPKGGRPKPSTPPAGPSGVSSAYKSSFGFVVGDRVLAHLAGEEWPGTLALVGTIDGREYVEVDVDGEGRWGLPADKVQKTEDDDGVTVQPTVYRVLADCIREDHLEGWKFAIYVEYRAGGTWTVRWQQMVLNWDGEWDYEIKPCDDPNLPWVRHQRFADLHEALKLARHHATRVKLGGKYTAAEYAAWQDEPEKPTCNRADYDAGPDKVNHTGVSEGSDNCRDCWASWGDDGTYSGPL
ncbi:hypothetical protein SEA_SKOG_72 [Gordonia phage Skog]|uniref:Uncharacterized protein n=1 Tax=Gordonia phage Skog TaxID=2704033 RepID=A0A6G6XJN0_9CAUD|nr:hypothetical protein KHQ85_gp072 [Gordonia phage Skog]QIG58224.1 hypothetical protein SEA_SKOG_72 [Gordonia phage Skog]